jgi:cytochrome oxidase Cu insertion factor (SCO1/SenC/PrrC family)
MPKIRRIDGLTPFLLRAICLCVSVLFLHLPSTQVHGGALVDQLAGLVAERDDVRLYAGAHDAPAISGTNWDGKAFHLHDLKGRVVLVYFGYLSCPDVCPTTLLTLALAKDLLGASEDEIAVVFVSLDPLRDQPEIIAKYIVNFDEKFFGVHVGPGDLRRITDAYGVKFAPSQDGRFIDHTDGLYAIDPDGRLVWVARTHRLKREDGNSFLVPQEPERIVELVRPLLAMRSP